MESSCQGLSNSVWHSGPRLREEGAPVLKWDHGCSCKTLEGGYALDSRPRWAQMSGNCSRQLTRGIQVKKRLTSVQYFKSYGQVSKIGHFGRSCHALGFWGSGLRFWASWGTTTKLHYLWAPWRKVPKCNYIRLRGRNLGVPGRREMYLCPTESSCQGLSNEGRGIEIG